MLTTTLGSRSTCLPFQETALIVRSFSLHRDIKHIIFLLTKKLKEASLVFTGFSKGKCLEKVKIQPVSRLQAHGPQHLRVQYRLEDLQRMGQNTISESPSQDAPGEHATTGPARYPLQGYPGIPPTTTGTGIRTLLPDVPVCKARVQS